MPKPPSIADTSPRYCVGCGLPLKESKKLVEQYDPLTGDKVTIKVIDLICPDHPFTADGVSLITGIKHSRITIELKA
jgi:hypothetical protein